VVDLLGEVSVTRERFGEDVAGSEPDRPLRGELPPLWNADEGPYTRSQGGALLHVYEELAQHRGQMEGARDCLLARHTSR
jgi:uncharacterized damage-inducible protein DinB